MDEPVPWLCGRYFNFFKFHCILPNEIAKLHSWKGPYKVGLQPTRLVSLRDPQEPICRSLPLCSHVELTFTNWFLEFDCSIGFFANS